MCDLSIVLQVIFAGDFFQLQPVEDKDTKTCIDQFLNRGLAFEARAWDRANLKMVILKRVFRQVCSIPSDALRLNALVVVFSQAFLPFKFSFLDFISNQICCEVQKDDHFVDLLNGIRTGENRAALEEIFENCSRRLPAANGIQPTVLYPRFVKSFLFSFKAASRYSTIST